MNEPFRHLLQCLTFISLLFCCVALIYEGLVESQPPIKSAPIKSAPIKQTKQVEEFVKLLPEWTYQP